MPLANLCSLAIHTHRGVINEERGSLAQEPLPALRREMVLEKRFPVPLSSSQV